MKYITFWEFNPEDIKKINVKNQKAAEIREKEPLRFPKYLFPPQYTEPGKGFSLVEISDPAQFNNANVYWFPEVKTKWIPCDDASEWIKRCLEMKK